MLLSALSFTATTSLVKYLGSDFPPMVQVFYRQLVGACLVVPLICHSDQPVLRTPAPGIMIFRAITSLFGTNLAFYSYQVLPLAEANALSFSRALWVVLLAAAILREPMGRNRVVAILAGFAGVMIILNPADQHFNIGVVAGLASAALLAGTVIGMKSIVRTHSTTTVFAFSVLLGLLLSIPAAFWAWHWPTTPQLLLLIAMGVLGAVTQTCYIKGMTAGEASVMATLDYTRLLFSIFAGWMFFNTLPGARAIVGSAVIVVATLYVTVLARPKKQPVQSSE